MLDLEQNIKQRLLKKGIIAALIERRSQVFSQSLGKP